MQIGDDDKIAIEALVQHGVITLQDVQRINPALMNNASELYIELGRRADIKQYLAFALLQCPTYMYIPQARPDVDWILRDIPREVRRQLLYDEIAIPLKKTAHTLWIGLGRAKPVHEKKIAELLNLGDGCIAWNIMLPAEFTEAVALLRAKEAL